MVQYLFTKLMYCYRFNSTLNVESIRRCNILEDAGDAVEYNKTERSTDWIVLHAFEILTLKLKVQ